MYVLCFWMRRYEPIYENKFTWLYYIPQKNISKTSLTKYLTYVSSFSFIGYKALKSSWER